MLQSVVGLPGETVVLFILHGNDKVDFGQSTVELPVLSLSIVERTGVPYPLQLLFSFFRVQIVGCILDTFCCLCRGIDNA